ncbi:MAG TPA: hypothetical protein VNY36_05965, partial [Bacteroidia bacterium]|nr:hypothetical protein [Bacteroidia bacterium]
PVVNMGLHASLGISYFLAETELVAKKGDIVIWSFEYYEADKRAINGDDDIKALAYNALPEIYDNLSWKDKAGFLQFKYFYYQGLNKRLHKLHHNAVKAPVALHWLSFITELVPGPGDWYLTNKMDSSRFVYKRAVFNKYGDIYTHLYLKPENSALADKNAGPNLKEGYKEEVELINNCADRLKDKGVRVYYYFPSFAQSEVEHNRAELDTLEFEYKKLLHVPVINSISTVAYPDSLFYNTTFHLNKIGREQNTRKIIDILKNKCNL